MTIFKSVASQASMVYTLLLKMVRHPIKRVTVLKILHDQFIEKGAKSKLYARY